MTPEEASLRLDGFIEKSTGELKEILNDLNRTDLSFSSLYSIGVMIRLNL